MPARRPACAPGAQLRLAARNCTLVSPFHTAIGTRARADEAVYSSVFASSQSPNSLYVLPSKGSSDQNILSDGNMRRLLQLHQDLLALNTSAGFSYQDLCTLVPGTQQCFIGGALGLGSWSMSPAGIFGPDGSKNASQRFDELLAAFPDYTSVLGGVDLQAKTVRSVEVVYVVQARGAVSAADVDEWVQAWFDAVRRDPPGLQLHELARFSIGRELSRAISGDITYTIIGFTLMFVYSVCVLTRTPSMVGLRVSLAGAGLVVVLLSVAAGYGIAAAGGVPFTTLNLILPLILLAIGVDDSYVMAAAWDARASSDRRPPPRLRVLFFPVKVGLYRAPGHGDEGVVDDEGEDPEVVAKASALASEGMSIVFTSLTDVLAFGVGSLTTVPALRWFTQYAASAVAWILILEILFFTAALELDSRRQAAQRWDVLCCFTSRKREAPSTPGATVPASPPAPENPSLQKQSRLAALIHTYYVPFLAQPVTQAVVIGVFGAVVAFSAWAVTQVRTGQPVSDLVPDDSYVLDWVNTVETVFDSAALSDFDVYVTALADLPGTAGQAVPPAPGDTTVYSPSPCTQTLRLIQDTRVALQQQPEWVVPTSLQDPWWYPRFLFWLSAPATMLAPMPAAVDAARAQWAARLVAANSTVPMRSSGEYPGYTLFNSSSCVEFGTALATWLNVSTPDTLFESHVRVAWSARPGAGASAADCARGRAGVAACMGVVQGLRYTARHEPSGVRNTADQVVTVFGVRDLVRDQGARYDIPQRAFSVWYLFTELDAIIVDEALLNIALASCGVVLLSLLFLGSATSALLVVAVLLMVDLALLGLIWWWGLRLNSISVVCLILSLGLALDYSAHIAHAFAHEMANLRHSAAPAPRKRKVSFSHPMVDDEQPRTPADVALASAPPGTNENPMARPELVAKSALASARQSQTKAVPPEGVPHSTLALDVALTGLGTSVFNGAFSTFLALLPIAFANSSIFRTFFRMFLGVSMLFGFTHGFVLLPVLLQLSSQVLEGCGAKRHKAVAAKDSSSEATAPGQSK